MNKESWKDTQGTGSWGYLERKLKQNGREAGLIPHRTPFCTFQSCTRSLYSHSKRKTKRKPYRMKRQTARAPSKRCFQKPAVDWLHQKHLDNSGDEPPQGAQASALNYHT